MDSFCEKQETTIPDTIKLTPKQLLNIKVDLFSIFHVLCRTTMAIFVIVGTRKTIWLLKPFEKDALWIRRTESR